MKRLIAPILLVAALAACGKSENKAADVGAPAPGNVQVDGPAPGQWRMTTIVQGQAMPPIEVCYKKRMTFAEAQEFQKQSGITCSENSYKRDGVAIIGHAVCVMEDKTKMVTDTRITGDFDKAYTMELKSTMDPAPVPEMAMTEMSVKAERLGDCPAE